jgi:hypothetical protein
MTSAAVARQWPANHTPIRWLHIPKAGQSFFLSVVLYGCRNASLVGRIHDFLSVSRTPAERHRLLQQALRLIPSVTDAAVCPGLLAPRLVGHAGLRDADLGSAVGLLRHPRQRILSRCSAYYLPNISASSAGFAACANAMATQQLGIMAYQIAGINIKNSLHVAEWKEPLPMVSIVHRAVKHLSRHFLFVGLQEEWTASVWLFHTMLMPSVPVIEIEMANVHKSPLLLSHPSWQQHAACDRQTDRCACPPISARPT